MAVVNDPATLASVAASMGSHYPGGAAGNMAAAAAAAAVMSNSFRQGGGRPPYHAGGGAAGVGGLSSPYNDALGGSQGPGGFDRHKDYGGYGGRDASSHDDRLPLPRYGDKVRGRAAAA